MPWPTVSVVVQFMTGTCMACNCSASEANKVWSKPDPNATAGCSRTTVSQAAFTLAGVPSLATTSTFQPRMPAAFLIAAAIVSQTATPQCTKLTVLPDGMGAVTGGRPIEVGRASATLSSASAAWTPADVEMPVTPAVLPAVLVPALLLLQAAITTASAAVSTAPATRRWRCGPRLRTILMCLSFVCAAPAGFFGSGRM